MYYEVVMYVHEEISSWQNNKVLQLLLYYYFTVCNN